MKEAGVTAGPVYNIADAMADPHFRERQVLVEIEDSELGSLPQGLRMKDAGKDLLHISVVPRGHFAAALQTCL